jgi:hypothetical protein
MPATYTIDAARGLVLSTASGTLTGDEMRGHQERLKADPDFRPDLDQLADFTGVDHLALSPQEIPQLAYNNPFREGSRRAIVVAQPLQYALVRMFQAMTESQGPEIEIFHEVAKAKRWLGLED